jgi:DNA-binding transcriptional MerR regulator
MKIGELARRAGVTVDTIRFYERRGVLPAPQRQRCGYRVYPEATLERLRLARSMRALGFKLDEIADGLRAMSAKDATCAGEKWRLERVLARLDRELSALERVRGSVVQVLHECDSGSCRFARSGAGLGQDGP